jgi:hypothetical protein
MVGNPNFIPSDELIDLSNEMLFTLTGSVKKTTKACKVRHDRILLTKPIEVITK